MEHNESRQLVRDQIGRWVRERATRWRQRSQDLAEGINRDRESLEAELGFERQWADATSQ
ncbi:MAG: hypothetical protein ABSF35_21050 [Polyangia bacterium]|jgi:hypothetical protein